MGDERATVVSGQNPAGLGLFWFAGWLFTMGYLSMPWWKDLLGLVVWPYYLGVIAR